MLHRYTFLLILFVASHFAALAQNVGGLRGQVLDPKWSDCQAPRSR